MKTKQSPSPRIAALALAALAAPACAQSGLVIYGTLLPNVDSVETRHATTSVPDERPTLVAPAQYTGQNQPRRTRMTGSTSNFGLRGTEELGHGLRVWFQIENAVGVDGEPPSGIATRNTGIGLEGRWGTVVLGQWDTPYKLPNIFMGSLRGSFQWEANNLVNTPGFNVPVTTTQSGRVNGKADAAFNRRQGNALQYWSPTWEGLSARAMVSVGEGRTPGSASTAAITPELWSALLRYERGPLKLEYAYERHDDYFGLAQLGGAAGATPSNAGARDDGHQVIATLRIDNWRFVGTWERLAYRTDDTVTGNVRRFAKDGWWLAAQPRFGAHQVWLSYGQAGKGSCATVGGLACSTSGLDGKQWSLGWSTALSKRTEVYAAVYEVRNGHSAQYTTWPALFAAPGADTRGLDVGVQHLF